MSQISVPIEDYLTTARTALENAQKPEIAAALALI